jgi:hypothetical protein
MSEPTTEIDTTELRFANATAQLASAELKILAWQAKAKGDPGADAARALADHAMLVAARAAAALEHAEWQIQYRCRQAAERPAREARELGGRILCLALADGQIRSVRAIASLIGAKTIGDVREALRTLQERGEVFRCGLGGFSIDRNAVDTPRLQLVAPMPEAAGAVAAQ